MLQVVDVYYILIKLLCTQRLFSFLFDFYVHVHTYIGIDQKDVNRVVPMLHTRKTISFYAACMLPTHGAARIASGSAVAVQWELSIIIMF